ncbi:hypothetical protein GE107_08205 [Cohnella sp. CFH 77786]|uniref:hypothetical protein n=1 Tax=Cohnella sp. CFH 77786 TaxID=2662265 RepID=UPI001C60CB23|nr:hypothetical protein [Cohnella sp. CFH 77786]MBW5446042.1 hypothetical protein [Cohnella sp. CFH 77786]
MKKLQICLFTIACLLLSPTAVSADLLDDDKVILRHVITKIRWDDFDKRILVDEMVIQKYENDPIQTYESGVSISGDSFQDETMTDTEAVAFVRKNDPEVFESDIIFGHSVEVFKDLSMVPNVSQQEIDKWVKLAEEQVLRDYESPPVFNGSDGPSIWNRFGASAIVFSAIFFLLLFFWKVIRDVSRFIVRMIRK